jgi:carboxyl-terminal processing protease
LQQAKYTKFNSGTNWQAVQQKADARIQANPAFSTLTKNSQWLSQNADKQYSLNLAEYQKEQSLIKSTVKQDDSLSRLKNPMDIQPVAVDRDRYYNNADSVKGDRYLQWLKNIQKDIYIDETVNIVQDMKSNEITKVQEPIQQ